MAGDCGNCRLCCKLLGVVELKKPVNTWCRNCNKTGCSIYEERPTTCAEFECGWLASGESPEKYRPDRLHLIITGDSQELGAFVVHVDPMYPDAWKKRDAARLLNGMMARGHKAIVLVTGDRRQVIGTDAALLANIRNKILAAKGELGPVNT